ncbi:hypothetical protein OS965_02210 [Streptomyces sp. H27-G5]|uniref:hypothetical protein n=1 Tax=Streptomyces sp. H27-G5 TaxID=2996698 RepID=UPI00226FB260|nr:hypothetical protein [Streptomyces sp. H27-G5]MCY0916989.1 hypothetical protein [Streptomyces sp. H27-G5]
MTAPRPVRLITTARTAAILRRCYRGQMPADVLERALVFLATADGHLDATGTPVPEQHRRRS